VDEALEIKLASVVADRLPVEAELDDVLRATRSGASERAIKNRCGSSGWRMLTCP